jgi:hypothetical protein
MRATGTTWDAARRTSSPSSWRKARQQRARSRTRTHILFWLTLFRSCAGGWPSDPFAALSLAVQGEVAALAAVKQARFREGLDWAQTAARLGISETRVRTPHTPKAFAVSFSCADVARVLQVRGVLRRDSVKIPLVQDAEPLEASPSRKHTHALIALLSLICARSHFSRAHFPATSSSPL